MMIMIKTETEIEIKIEIIKYHNLLNNQYPSFF